ncbi:MAG TPA: SUMF1/EgtB/PvdO family nonheme iron enzyme, partial [Planctomycetota bacterium]|nr:SUMF1/EgtB/PvdO family nonheme iron enzyme [Planctomycetota bacterium]
PQTVDPDKALRVVHEEVVHVRLDGQTEIQSPPASTSPVKPLPVPTQNNLGPTVTKSALVPAAVPIESAPKPEVVITPPVAKPKTPSALVEQPIDQALAPAIPEAPPVPTVDSKPAWASASGADRYGSWADLTVGTVVQRFRLCPAGPAQLGSPLDERGRGIDETLHRITIEQPYWFADTECTQNLWRTVMNDNPSSTIGDRLPVDQVSFQRVQEFLGRVGEKRSDVVVRLPSEPEWEAACRAGTRGPFTGGMELRSLAWYRATAGDGLSAVGGRRANAYGLFDVHGNVWEWCQAADRSYPPDADGLPVATHAFVYRGGGYADAADDCRLAKRGGNQTGDGSAGVGFRLAVSASLR